MSQGLFASAATPTPPGPPGDSPVAVVAAVGDLDEPTALRLLRWCEARLHRLDLGQTRFTHLVIDLGHAGRATPSAVAILEQARLEARRRLVGIHLVGVGPLMARAPLLVRHSLGRWSIFPNLEVAYAALNPGRTVEDPSPQRAVDPDAIRLAHPTP